MKLKMLGKRMLVSSLLTIMFFAAGISAFVITSSPKSAEAWECKNQNVIICGVSDKDNLVSQVTNGDGVHTDIRSIFQASGITVEDIASQTTLSGVVTRDGRVLVNGTQVAANVNMGERATTGVGGTSFAGLLWNPPSARFDTGVDQVGAFVHIVNGQFTWAVIASCGNPVLTSFAPQNNLTITKEVRNVTANPSGTTFAKSVQANVGDTIRFRIRVFNNGLATVQNVTVKDALPSGLTLVPGSAQTVLSQLVNNAWQTQTSTIADAEVLGGKNVGSLQPNQDGYMIFNTIVASGLSGGCHTLVDTASATSGQIIVRDTANAVVCIQTPPPPPSPPTPPTPVTPSTTPTATVASVSTTPTALPTSGPVEAAGGVMGTAGLGYVGYLWRKSRKKLTDTLMKR